LAEDGAQNHPQSLRPPKTDVIRFINTAPEMAATGSRAVARMTIMIAEPATGFLVLPPRPNTTAELLAVAAECRGMAVERFPVGADPDRVLDVVLRAAGPDRNLPARDRPFVRTAEGAT
jgi:hypothetical protein